MQMNFFRCRAYIIFEGIDSNTACPWYPLLPERNRKKGEKNYFKIFVVVFPPN